MTGRSLVSSYQLTLFFCILEMKLWQSCQLCWSRGQATGVNPTPARVSEHEETYNDIPPVRRKSGPRGWLPCM